jgi:hypothetical protein
VTGKPSEPSAVRRSHAVLSDLASLGQTENLESA